MINTALFIRNDYKLIESIEKLSCKSQLKYIVFKDDEIDSKILRITNRLEDCVVLSHKSFQALIQIGKAFKIDYIFSYYYQERIDKELLDFPKKGAINFHPAPLPKYRGVGSYSRCILDGLKEWGASAHYMDEIFDNGNLIKKINFKIDPDEETYYSLENKTRYYMNLLFNEVVDLAVNDKIKIEISNEASSEIVYTSRSMINELKKISSEETNDVINKKIRAFWCPPFNGAFIEINGEKFTLVSEKVIKQIKKTYDK